MRTGGAEQLPLLVKSDFRECVSVVYGVKQMASNKVKTRPERCSLERRLKGLEVDLKGEAQVVRYLPGLT